MKMILVPKPVDPLRPEIERRLALKQAAGKRETVPAPPVGTEALFDVAAYMRANPVSVVVLEAS